MLQLFLTTDKVSLITSAAATLDVHASFMDMTQADPPVVKGTTSGKQNTAITTATTTDIVAAPDATTTRNVKEIIIRNKHASLATDVTVQFNANATLFELIKVTVPAGSTLEYTEATGWFLIANTLKLNARLYVTADYVNATTSFSDITGLTCPVESGKHYCFLAHLDHQSDATTSGSQFGINGPAMTLMSLHGIQQITFSVTAAAVGSSASVTALDTAAVVETTGPGAVRALAILSGYINPSASGTFAMRGKSEVAVAAGLTVKKGSWCNIWEVPA